MTTALELTTAAAAVISRCPACASTESTQVGAEAPGSEIVAGGKVFVQPSFTIRCCGSCGLYFKTPTLNLDQLQEYYGRLEYEMFEADGDYPTDRHLKKWLESLPDGSKILDFGCSSGRVLKEFVHRFDCVGVEPNEVAAALAQSRGIRMISEEHLRSGVERDFDAIVLADVYEHLIQPVKLLETLVGLLAPGGRLAIVTGNADAVRTRSYIGEYWYFRPPGHLHMLGERHVRWLAERLSLELRGLHRCSHYRLPLVQRIRQSAQAFAYDRFRRDPGSAVAKLLRRIPLLNRAQFWRCAPARTHGVDHVVVVLSRSQNECSG